VAAARVTDETMGKLALSILLISDIAKSKVMVEIRSAVGKRPSRTAIIGIKIPEA
jgi:hypothetical protein